MIDIDALVRRIGSEFDDEASLSGEEMRAVHTRIRELEAALGEALRLAMKFEPFDAGLPHEIASLRKLLEKP